MPKWASVQLLHGQMNLDLAECYKVVRFEQSNVLGQKDAEFDSNICSRGCLLPSTTFDMYQVLTIITNQEV